MAEKNPLDRLLDKLIDGSTPTRDGVHAVEAQLEFKNGKIVAGAVTRVEEGLYKMATVGQQADIGPDGRPKVDRATGQPRTKPIMVEMYFTTDILHIVSLMMDESKIIKPEAVLSPH